MKNSNKKILSLVLFCCIGFLSISASARIIKVTSAGDGIQANDSSDITLRKALEISKSGDVIKLELSNQKPIIIYYPIDIIEDVTIEGNGDTIKIQPINPTIDPPRVFNVFAKLTLKDATLIGGNVSNVPDDSGGVIKIYSGGSLNAERTTIENGKAVNGGGIYCEANSSLDLLNSTIGGNTAESGGGIYFAGSNGTAILNAVTIAGNTATSTNGNQFYLKDGTLSISNTILASFGKTMTGSDYYLEGGAIADLGFNIIRTSAYYDWVVYGDCNGSDSSAQYFQVGTMASGMLNLASDLADNGGKTPTYEISASDSIAVSIIKGEYPAFKMASAEHKFSDSFLSADGSVALIGNKYMVPKGQAYFYIKDGTTWELKQTFTGKSADCYFGEAVALSADGSVALIGAGGSTSVMGQAYVYHKTGSGSWGNEIVIYDPDKQSDGGFGAFVALSADGNTALITAIGIYENKNRIVYIFRKNEDDNWDLEAKIPDPSTNNSAYGAPISISSDGNIALIGDYSQDGLCGSVYVYIRSGSTWTLQQKLNDPDVTSGDCFGISLDLIGNGNTALIGAFGADSHKGAAYIYSKKGDTWELQQKINDPDLTNSFGFGCSVALSDDGNTALVGAIGKYAVGKVYVYRKKGEGWELERTINNPADTQYNMFGNILSISADGSTALINADGDDSSSEGVTYFLFSGAFYNGLPSIDQREYTRNNDLRTIGAFDYNAIASNALNGLKL